MSVFLQFQNKTGTFLCAPKYYQFSQWCKHKHTNFGACIKNCLQYLRTEYVPTIVIVLAQCQ